MAVSGSKDFSITRSDIIEGALRKIGVYDQGESIDGADTSAASFSLNLMVKEWIAEGADLFLRTESTLFLQPNVSSYNLSTDHITDSYVETTLEGAETSGSTVIEVASSAGMTAADFVGIKQNNNSIHWSTIVSVDSATQITITDPTTDDAAAGKKVYAYTTKSDRPQKILFAMRRDIDNFDTEVRIIGEKEYQLQSIKTTSGPPIEVWYNHRGNQATGTLRVWPTDGGTRWDKLVLINQILPDDFDSSSNNPDFPIEWGNALVWGLAAEMASEYGLPQQEIAYLEAKARHKLDLQLDYDVENANVIIAMDYGRSDRR